MKRQIQKPGVREWFADDLLAMQDELYRAIEQGLLGQLSHNLLLSGADQGTAFRHNSKTRYKIGRAVALIQGELCVFEGSDTEQARLNDHNKTSAPDNSSHFWFKKAAREEGLTPYQNNQQLPTLRVVGMEISASSGSDTVKVERRHLTTPTARLLLPYYDASRILQGLPTEADYTKAGLSTTEQQNLLATFKGLRDLYRYATAAVEWYKVNVASGADRDNLVNKWNEIVAKFQGLSEGDQNLGTLLAGKANASHTHPWGQITSKPNRFAPSSHKHTFGQITGKITEQQIGTKVVSNTKIADGAVSLDKLDTDLMVQRYHMNKSAMRTEGFSIQFPNISASAQLNALRVMYRTDYIRTRDENHPLAAYLIDLAGEDGQFCSLRLNFFVRAGSALTQLSVVSSSKGTYGRSTGTSMPPL